MVNSEESEMLTLWLHSGRSLFSPFWCVQVMPAGVRQGVFPWAGQEDSFFTRVCILDSKVLCQKLSGNFHFLQLAPSCQGACALQKDGVERGHGAEAGIWW